MLTHMEQQARVHLKAVVDGPSQRLRTAHLEDTLVCRVKYNQKNEPTPNQL